MADKKYDFSDFDKQPKTEGYDFSDFDNKEEPTKTATAVGSGLQGLLMGFSDEAEGGIGTALRAAGIELDNQGNFKQMTSPTLDTDVLSETYRKVRDDARKKLDIQKEANPNTALISELIGGVATPAFGAATIAKGAAQASKFGKIAPAIASASAIGATGAALTGAGEADEMSDITAESVGKDALVGGSIGAALGGLGAVGGKLVDTIQGTKMAEDISKVFSKTKAGEKLTGKGVSSKLNDELLDEGQKITDKIYSDFDKFKQSYDKQLANIIIDKPQESINKISKAVDDFVSDQVATGIADPRKINKTISDLRKNVDLNNEEIAGLTDLITKKSQDARLLASQNKFGNVVAGKTIAKSQKEIADEVVKMKSEKLDLQLQLKELKRIPKEERDLLEQRVLEDKIDALTRNIFDTNDVLRNTKFSDKLTKIDTTTGQKATQDITSEAGDAVTRINQLKNTNAEINREISNIISDTQGGLSNPALNGLVNQVDALMESLKSQKLTAKTISNSTILDSIRQNAEAMGKPHLFTQIRDIVVRNNPEWAKANAAYAGEHAKLAAMGLAKESPDFSKSMIKEADAVGNLVSRLKSATKNETGDAANKLALKSEFMSPEVQGMLDKMTNKAESYNLAEKIRTEPIKSVGLRGASIAGDFANSGSKMMNVISDNALGRAVTKLGDGPLGQRVKQVISMPEGEAKERALFTLSQQGWFRSATNNEYVDENEK